MQRPQDHFASAGVAYHDPPGSGGRAKDWDYDEANNDHPRFIGRGKRHGIGPDDALYAQ